VCFLVSSPYGRTYLFTGDTFFLNNGAWEKFVVQLAGGTKSDFKNSLILLRDLEPGVVISSSSLGAIPFKEVSAGTWRSDIDNILRAL
jgi:hydroxyacylglutathione hydrolase